MVVAIGAAALLAGTGVGFGAARVPPRPPAETRGVVMLSWEHPPIVERGLARHVGKLAEQPVRDGVEVMY